MDREKIIAEIKGKLTPESLTLYVLGLVFIPLGVVLTINSHAGAGGYDALNFALAELLGIKTSYTICMTAVLALLAAALIRRGVPRLTCFITSYLFGVSTDFWNAVLAGVQGTSLIGSAAFLAAGMAIVGAGIASYTQSGFPAIPTDDMISAFRERKIPIWKGKICMDAVCVGAALALGGEIGWGTVAVTFGLGPVIQVFHSRIEHMRMKRREQKWEQKCRVK